MSCDFKSPAKSVSGWTPPLLMTYWIVRFRLPITGFVGLSGFCFCPVCAALILVINVAFVAVSSSWISKDLATSISSDFFIFNMSYISTVEGSVLACSWSSNACLTCSSV